MKIKVLTFVLCSFVTSASAQPFTSYDVFKAALDRTDYLLQPVGDGAVNMQSALNNSYYPDAVLVISWVRRDELLVRKIRIAKNGLKPKSLQTGDSIAPNWIPD